MNLEKFFLAPEKSIKDALVCLNSNQKGIVLIVDSEHILLGTITDGDIRRALLEGKTLATEVSKILNENPIFLTEDMEESTFQSVVEVSGIRQLPVLNRERKVIDIFFSKGIEPLKKVHGVIMAGGEGKRLRPLTENTPKPLLSLGKNSIIEDIILKMAKAGIQNITISTGFKKDKVIDFLGDGSKWKVNLDYIEEPKPLGTLGALGFLDVKSEFDYLVSNGDIVSTVDIGSFVRFHRRHRSDITVAVHRVSHEIQYGVVEINGFNVVSLSEKPSYDFNINAGMYIIKGSLVKKIKQGVNLDATQFIKEHLQSPEVKINAFLITERWIDVGSPENLKIAREEANS